MCSWVPFNLIHMPTGRFGKLFHFNFLTCVTGTAKGLPPPSFSSQSCSLPSPRALLTPDAPAMSALPALQCDTPTVSLERRRNPSFFFSFKKRILPHIRLEEKKSELIPRFSICFGGMFVGFLGKLVFAGQPVIVYVWSADVMISLPIKKFKASKLGTKLIGRLVSWHSWRS